MSWWNSPDTVSLASSIARWAGACIAVVILILGHRLTTLQGMAKEIEKNKTEAAIEEARGLAKMLEERQTPRSVSAEQRTKFVTALRNAPKGKLSVYSFMNADTGTIQYANQIREMVVAAGYDSGVMVGMSIGGGPIPVGAAIAVRDPAIPPPFAGQVQRALADSGLPMKGITDSSAHPDEVKIIIGLKPQ